MIAVPITLKEANEFIKRFHRHHKPTVGHRFSIGCSSDGENICGVAVVGRPVARHLDDGKTAEITRVCTDGTRNASSFLLGRCRRVASAMGYSRIITYTFIEEGGASLRASGFKCEGLHGGGNWNTKSRPRVDTEHQQKKLRWEGIT